MTDFTKVENSEKSVALSEKITELVGFYLGSDHIHHIEADGSGYYYYVRKLKPGHPVLLMHYRGPLVLMLPFEDFQRLNHDEITVDEYIATSHFSYGYFWGGGNILSGGYWQPLESEPGIHDRERISRYLHILSCRTHKNSCGYPPTEEQCQKCRLDATACPFSPLNQVGSWDNEVPEPDGRYELFKIARECIERELGFKVEVMSYHDDADNELRIFPSYEPDTIGIGFSQSLLNDLLYYPKQERDWQQMVRDFTVIINDPQGSTQKVSLVRNDPRNHQICLDAWPIAVTKWEKLKQLRSRDASPSINSSPIKATKKHWWARLWNHIKGESA